MGNTDKRHRGDERILHVQAVTYICSDLHISIAFHQETASRIAVAGTHMSHMVSLSILEPSTLETSRA